MSGSCVPSWKVEDLDRQVLTSLAPSESEEPPAEDKAVGDAQEPTPGD